MRITKEIAAIPTGNNVSKELRLKIIELLRHYAGADNPEIFNWSITVGFGVTPKFAKYVDSNYDQLFGKVNINDNNKTYYPLCLWAYYNRFNNNKAMFKLKDELLKGAASVIPTERDVMKWFYSKHKNELVGLIKLANRTSSDLDKEAFIDQFMDSIYLNGDKIDGKYILTLKQAKQAASEMYQYTIKNGK